MIIKDPFKVQLQCKDCSIIILFCLVTEKVGALNFALKVHQNDAFNFKMCIFLHGPGPQQMV